MNLQREAYLLEHQRQRLTDEFNQKITLPKPDNRLETRISNSLRMLGQIRGIHIHVSFDLNLPYPGPIRTLSYVHCMYEYRNVKDRNVTLAGRLPGPGSYGWQPLLRLLSAHPCRNDGLNLIAAVAIKVPGSDTSNVSSQSPPTPPPKALHLWPQYSPAIAPCWLRQ